MKKTLRFDLVNIVNKAIPWRGPWNYQIHSLSMFYFYPLPHEDVTRKRQGNFSASDGAKNSLS